MENNKKLKVLVACEESQVIMKEFRKLGHDAFSNDIIGCSGDLPYYHIRIDCLDAIKINNWDLLIAHPPCTYLSYCNTSKCPFLAATEQVYLSHGQLFSCAYCNISK